MRTLLLSSKGRVIVALLTSTFSVPLSATILNVQLIPQRAPVWCWAASSEMAFDFLNPSQAASVGQCSMAKIADQDCKCTAPDTAKASDPDCNKLDPFGAKDFIPKLLKETRVTPSDPSSPKAIAGDLLKCEIQTRESPVLFWPRGGDNCANTVGHISVAAGLVETQSKGGFVYVLDPWPVNKGDKYWFTRKGFSCGSIGLGQCTAYYNFRRETEARQSCSGATEEGVSCNGDPAEHEKITNLDQVAAYLGDLFKSPEADELLKGLGIDKSTNPVTCGTDLILRGALPVPGTPRGPGIPYRQTDWTRILCSYGSFEFSALVSRAGTDGFYLAAFGGHTTTDLLRSRTTGLMNALRQQHLAPAEGNDHGTIELEELFLPGLGEMILITTGSPGGYAVRLQEAPGKFPRPLKDLLNEKLEDGSQETIRHAIERSMSNQ
jgi:hypothetical protein